MSDALREGAIRLSPQCRDAIREFGLYRWKENTPQDAPVKDHDHAMDDIRYFVATILAEGPPGGCFAAVRRGPPGGPLGPGTGTGPLAGSPRRKGEIL